MVEENLIGPCGLYCGWCPFYVVGSKEFTCKGWWAREKCEIRDCAKSKGLKLYGMHGQMDKFFDNIKKAFPKGVVRS
ncbi:MAG: hypothetical protein QW667_05735 [Candidatus Bathyarchaeia archaeon]